MWSSDWICKAMYENKFHTDIHLTVVATITITWSSNLSIITPMNISSGQKHINKIYVNNCALQIPNPYVLQQNVAIYKRCGLWWVEQSFSVIYINTKTSWGGGGVSQHKKVNTVPCNTSASPHCSTSEGAKNTLYTVYSRPPGILSFSEWIRFPTNLTDTIYAVMCTIYISYRKLSQHCDYCRRCEVK